MLDGETGRILEANHAALNLYGYSRDELVKKNINELSAEVEKTRESLKNSVGRVPLRWHYKKDGTIFPVELALTMHSQNGRSIIISTARDITERIESEEALRISENNFRNSLESSPLGIGIVDENWKFIYANPSLLELWGYATAEELSMVPLNRRFTAEGYRLYLERHNKRDKGEYLPETFEQEILNKKGDIRIVEIRISSVFWNNQSRLMGTYSDITEKKQSKELLTILAERSPIGVYIAQDGKFKYVNIPLRQYLGYSTDDLINTHTLDYVFHDDRKMVQFNVIKMLKKNITFPYEHRVICKDNQIKWVIETVVRVVYQGQQAILGSIIDITPIKNLEKKVVEFEELNKLKTDILSTVSHELRTPLT
ncbi:MAG: PAS domain S-box protein, partial [Chloroflexi bacterium]|nr:PAS domain S-box protein [Chloroflexota bacterium]